MNSVGIDVSKGKSMIAVMRPFGEIVVTPYYNIFGQESRAASPASFHFVPKLQ